MGKQERLQMIGKLLDTISSNPPPEIEALIELMGIVVQDGKYNQFVNEELARLPGFQKRKPMLEAGHFSGTDLAMLVRACSNASGANVPIVGSMLHQLKDWMLVSDNGIVLSNHQVRYQWNKNRIALFISLRILDNVLLGQGYVAQKYRQSVPAVFVKKSDGEFTGTGFLATSLADAKKYVIVTAKHNVDPCEGITFISFGSSEGVSYKPLARNWLLHDKLDLAAMPVECSETPVPIYPVGPARVLSRTITLGYPRIATTDKAYLLAHGGELNAVVKDYHGEERLIISNIVAPGNSGGPVLDEAGLCVGMVVSSYKTEYVDGVSVANSAIPSGAILQFITPYLT